MKKIVLLMIMSGLLVFSLSACKKTDSENGAGTEIETETSAEAESEPEENTPVFGSFQSTDISGNPVDQEVLKNAEITVLNIWGTYCGPCLSEMPGLGNLSREYKDKGVQFIGIPVDVYDEKSIETANQIIDETGADYLHILLSQDLIDAYVGSVSAIPETLFLDKDGNILNNVVGSRSEAEWREMIDALLAE